MGKNLLIGTLFLFSAFASTPANGQVYGPPDRMIITNFMASSSMQLKDMNGDQTVSDVDASMMVLDRLVALYGENLDVGDADGNGVVNGEDTVAAIAKIVRGSFGKTTDDLEPIGIQDLTTTADNVASQSTEGDLNFDDCEDAQDVLVTAGSFGTDVEYGDQIDEVSRELFNYIGAILEMGREYFMRAEAASITHIEGVSSTWPAKHPPWWRPNHMVTISNSYNPPGPPNPPAETEHLTNISKSWPPNHFKTSSATWPPPPTHDPIISALSVPSVVPGTHADSTSSLWPATHTFTISNGWGTDHEVQISRTWWPMHYADESRQHIWPPRHADSVSGLWVHQESLSRSSWPPNHLPLLSDTWATHDTGRSAMYPPEHYYSASQEWPGPQPGWPGGHVGSVSRSWGEPGQQPWPIFPPDHSWFTTFSGLPGIIPRNPWLPPESP